MLLVSSDCFPFEMYMKYLSGLHCISFLRSCWLTLCWLLHVFCLLKVARSGSAGSQFGERFRAGLPVGLGVGVGQAVGLALAEAVVHAIEGAGGHPPSDLHRSKDAPSLVLAPAAPSASLTLQSTRVYSYSSSGSSSSWGGGSSHSGRTAETVIQCMVCGSKLTGIMCKRMCTARMLLGNLQSDQGTGPDDSSSMF